MADLTEAEKAYAAGFFDGEGCVQVYMRGDSSRTRNCMSTALSASGTDLGPLNWIQERWGGRIHIYSGQVGVDRRGVVSRKAQGRWIIYAYEAEVFARDIQPYLIIKREQLDLWLYARTLLQPRGGNRYRNGLTPEEEVHRMEIVNRVKELKRVG